MYEQDQVRKTLGCKEEEAMGPHVPMRSWQVLQVEERVKQICQQVCYMFDQGVHMMLLAPQAVYVSAVLGEQVCEGNPYWACVVCTT
jgi:hypothetical protein